MGVAMVVACALARMTNSRLAPTTRLPEPEMVRPLLPAFISPFRVVGKPALASVPPLPVKRRVLAVIAPA